MKSLEKQIAKSLVANGKMNLWWLGGSGFVLKNDSGATLYIDPYLSNAAEGIFGLSRAFPSPIDADAARPAVVVATHSHEDHLDPAAIPIIARNCPETRFIMPPSAASRAASWGVPLASIETLREGQTIETAGFTISHVAAVHDAGIAGWETPDAMGVVVTTRGASIYHSGDTEYTARITRSLRIELDLATVCMNGATGNMDAHEAAMLAWRIKARYVVPHHHFLWSTDPSGGQATLDPTLFEDTYRRLGGKARVVLPEVGAELRL